MAEFKDWSRKHADGAPSEESKKAEHSTNDRQHADEGAELGEKKDEDEM